MSTTTKPAPVKGMKFAHAVRTNWRGEPVVGTVTSVSEAKDLVYWVDPLWPDRRKKTPLSQWDHFCAEVLSMPEPAVKPTAVRMSASEAKALHQKAHAAGMAAGEAARPTPMIVQEHANPLDDTSPVVREYAPVMDGVCGFGIVRIRPGNSSYARWVKAAGLGRKGYTGGVEIWVRAFGQSAERKGAYADAYAEVLREAGLTAYSEMRLD